MATPTVSTAPTDNLLKRTSPSARPPLWQAPIFIVGLGALLSVWFGRPLWCADTPARRLDRDLATARRMLSHAEGDPEQALRLMKRWLEPGAGADDRAGEVRLLVGTAHMRLAERAAPEKAAELWREARAELEEAEHLGVPEDLKVRLTYRLGKVGFHTDDDLNKVIGRLEESAAGSDSRAEAYALLTQAYLRLPEPDLNRALEANVKLRGVPGGEVSEQELATAKLVGGDILLRLGKLDEARKTLEKVGENAPPAVSVRAQMLRARSYEQERKWSDAVLLYQKALAEARVPVPDPDRANYHLGLCYRQLDQPAEAARAWQECVRLSEGPEGPAAALRLAEAQLASGQPDKALQALAAAVDRVRSAAEWTNPLVDLAGARGAFEQAVTALRSRDRHDLALRLLESYERLAEPGRALLLRGEVSAEWGRARREKAAQLPEEQARKAEEQEARKLLRQAAEAYAEAARRPGLKPGEEVELLWLGSGHYLACEEWAEVLKLLDPFVKAASSPIPKELAAWDAHLGEGWYRLAEAHRQLGNIPAAITCYHNCIGSDKEHPTRFAALSLYQRALIELGKGDLDNAAETLKQCVGSLRYHPDAEALEKSLFTLGELLYKRRKFRDAERYLSEALAHFKDAAEAPKARYELADCYRQIANQENQSWLVGSSMTAEMRAHFQKEHRRWLLKAAEEFGELDRYLDSPAGKDALTAEQRVQVPFITAKCWFNLGGPGGDGYRKALAIYEKLIERYSGKVEGLDALGGAVSCHAALGERDRMRQRLLQIQEALPRMHEDVRKPWEGWLAEVVKNLGPLEATN